MNITVSLTEILLLVMTITLVVGTVVVIRFAAQMLQSMRRVERTTDRLEPQVERVLAETAAELEALQALTQSLRGIGQDAEALSSKLTETAVPLIEDVDRLRETKRYVVAAGKGVRAGMRVWKELQEQNNSHEKG